ncbi:hypothetical protein EWM64_g5851 [Hericium alpestre]|uniref:Uncharacterized protein n=1 Tax=Hericium alpestre TaxID=135208 RepID=A0A4Y9ZW93_9AGAM|nr:hypothetical protein EWM64_g5851 [Hericium alpestre]
MSKKHARALSATDAQPINKKAKGAEEKEMKPEPASDFIKLYAWVFEECVELEFQTSFGAARPADLEKLKTWKPNGRDGKKGIPDLLAVEFDTRHDSLSSDHDGSRDIAKLLDPYLSGKHGYVVDSTGNKPRDALMEFTLVNRKPAKGAFASVSIDRVSYSLNPEWHESDGRHRLHKWVTAVRIEYELKALRMVRRLLNAHRLSLDDRNSIDGNNSSDDEHPDDNENSDEDEHSNDSGCSDDDQSSDEDDVKAVANTNVTGNTGAEDTIESDSIRLYAWTYEDGYSDTVRFSAILPNDLNKLMVWKPKNKDDVEDRPELLELELGDHKWFEDDVEGRSRDIVKLFPSLIENEAEFWLHVDGEPNFAVLDVTVSKNQPEASPFVAVDISSAFYSPSDGFMSKEDSGAGNEEEHYLQKQDFCYVTAVEINRDVATAKMAQRLVKVYKEEAGSLLESKKRRA